MNPSGFPSHAIQSALASIWGHPRGPLNVHIHPCDDMYRYLISLGRTPEVAFQEYLQTGSEIASLIEQIAVGAGIPMSTCRFLDYASGFGRSTRFLRSRFPSLAMTVADINGNASAFQDAEFGVDTMDAAATPEALFADAPYDVVSVISLLTHVPRHTFEAWLGALLRCVATGGILIFTVHDMSVGGDHVVPAREFAFHEYAVDFDAPQGYGDSYVTEKFVQDSIRRVGARTIRRFPRGLNRHQDVWVVSRDPERHMTNPKLCVPPEVCIDAVRVARSPGFECAGWAAMGHEPVRLLNIWLNSELLGSAAVMPRDDLSAHFGNPASRYCGWYFRSSHLLAPGDVLLVDAYAEQFSRTVRIAASPSPS